MRPNCRSVKTVSHNNFYNHEGHHGDNQKTCTFSNPIVNVAYKLCHRSKLRIVHSSPFRDMLAQDGGSPRRTSPASDTPGFALTSNIVSGTFNQVSGLHAGSPTVFRPSSIHFFNEPCGVSLRHPGRCSKPASVLSLPESPPATPKRRRTGIVQRPSRNRLLA